MIDARAEHAAHLFLQRTKASCPAIEARLFGSRAHGAHREDSDADLALILRGAAGKRYKVAGEMAEIAFDILVETGVFVDPLPLWEDEWNHRELTGVKALIEGIKREGLPV